MGSLLEDVLLSRQLPDPATCRAIRRMANVSQVRLAHELGVHRMTIIRWETGERKPRGAQRADYARLLVLLKDACS